MGKAEKLPDRCSRWTFGRDDVVDQIVGYENEGSERVTDFLVKLLNVRMSRYLEGNVVVRLDEVMSEFVQSGEARTPGRERLANDDTALTVEPMHRTAPAAFERPDLDGQFERGAHRCSRVVGKVSGHRPGEIGNERSSELFCHLSLSRTRATRGGHR